MVIELKRVHNQKSINHYINLLPANPFGAQVLARVDASRAPCRFKLSLRFYIGRQHIRRTFELAQSGCPSAHLMLPIARQRDLHKNIRDHILGYPQTICASFN